MLRGGDKSYTCICDAAVIARLCCEGGLGRHLGSDCAGSRHEYARGVSGFWEVVLCLRSKHFPMDLCTFTDLDRLGILAAQRL
jgi:hypothetical protein